MNGAERSAGGTRAIWGVILGFAGVAMFGGSLPATRLAVADFDPAFLTFARAFIATAGALICVVAMRRRFPVEHLSALIAAAAMLVFAFPGFMAIAMLTLPSAHGGVVLGILPLATAIFAVILAGERPSGLFWLCGVAGTVLVIVFTLRDGGAGFEAGDVWLLFAGLAASCGYVISGKLSHHMPGWEVICWALLLTGPISAAGTLGLWQPGYPAASATSISGLLYVGLISMFLGFFAWNEGLRIGGVAKIGQLQLLQTFVTLAIAAIVLGEEITTETMLFALAVLIVVAIGRRARVSAPSARG